MGCTLGLICHMSAFPLPSGQRSKSARVVAPRSAAYVRSRVKQRAVREGKFVARVGASARWLAVVTVEHPRAHSAGAHTEREFIGVGPCVVLASRPNRSVERTSRLRRSAAHFQRWVSSAA